MGLVFGVCRSGHKRIACLARYFAVYKALYPGVCCIGCFWLAAQSNRKLQRSHLQLNSS